MEKRPVQILKTLEDAGFQAYFVGGCVRDILLGRPVHDWDMTTSATPEEMIRLFPKTVPTGLKHGTVLVLDGGRSFEVTTFRKDGDYRDSRHPEQVCFVKNLEEDLARRDFTVNAMAMDKEGRLYDFFGGQEDLGRKLLRTVGEPHLRFSEDALRMLRLFRFSAQLGFSMDGAALDAVAKLCNLAEKLSVERIRDELEKTLLSPRPEMVGTMAEYGLLAHLGISAPLDLAFLSQLPATPELRWAGLFTLCPSLCWQTLRLPGKLGITAQESARLVGARTEVEWKQLIAQKGEEIALCTAHLSHAGAQVEAILQSGDCLTLRDLAVRGEDFPQYRGKELGMLLHRLLEHVLLYPEDNCRERLLELAREEKEVSKKEN